jgi:hypothetical protein
MKTKFSGLVTIVAIVAIVAALAAVGAMVTDAAYAAQGRNGFHGCAPDSNRYLNPTRYAKMFVYNML